MQSESCLFSMVKKISVLIGAFLLLFSYDRKEVIEMKGIENGFVSMEEKVSFPEVEKMDTRKTEEVFGYLTIPKLTLYLPFYSLESKENTVSKNIQMIKSNMPDVKNGNFVLAGHSGNSSVSYFRNLNHLQIGDQIIVTYQGKDYLYEVLLLYETLKKDIEWKIPTNETVLTLITCVPFSDKRLMVIARQI